MTCSTASNSGKFAWSGVGIEEGTTLKGITFRLSDFFFNKGLEHESGFFIATPCIVAFPWQHFNMVHCWPRQVSSTIQNEHCCLQWQSVTMSRYTYIAYLVCFHYSAYSAPVPVSRSFTSLFSVPEAPTERHMQTCVQHLLCTGVKLDLSYAGRSTAWRFSRRGCWRKIMRPKREEVQGQWRRLHNEESVSQLVG